MEQSFDKRTILAFVLIGAVFLAWSFLFSPTPEKPAPGDSTLVDQAPITDTVAGKGEPGRDTVPPAPTTPGRVDYGASYAALTQGNETFYTIETPLYTAVLNSRGGLLARFQLKEYNAWYGAPVQLITDSAGFPGELGISYKNSRGQEISTRDFFFEIEAPAESTLGEGDSLVIIARAVLGDTATADSGAAAGPAPTIEKRFVFYGDSYGLGFDVDMQNMGSEIADGHYRITWNDGLKYQEHNSVDESGKAQAMVASGEDLVDFDAAEIGVQANQNVTGNIHWVGLKTKYFGAALIPDQVLNNSTVKMTGTAVGADSSGVVETYALDVAVPYSTASASRSFTLFLGPLDYDIASEYGVQDMVDFGWKLVIRPIAEFIMLPMFHLIHTVIPNWGLVIIVFSILVRLALWPLSIPQIKSSRKMQLLQPKIAELREKYKDDMQRQQMETMQLYRKYGINPVGGCLPLLLQMPILYALWATLSNAIDLRQAGFAFWIHDLSIPDALIHLPFSLPLLGNQLSGLALIMGATLFIQQKMLITDPKQKMMIYFMPVLLTIAFNYLPSGLNLYYLIFNLLSIGQQVYMTKYSKSKLTLEDLKKNAAGKKKGWLSRKMEEAQKMAEMQQQGRGGSGGAGKSGNNGKAR